MTPTAQRVVRILAGAIIAAAIPAVLLAHWVYFPLTPELRGAAFALTGYSPHHANFIPASFGTAAALLLIVAAAAVLARRPAATAIAGACLILLVWVAYLHIAVSDPDLTLTLALQADWAQAAHFFSVEYIPGNFGSEPTAWPALSFDTVYDRLFSGWYFLGLGAYLAFVAGLWLTAAGLHAAHRRIAKIIVSTLAGAAALLALLALSGPLLAQRAFGLAVAAEVRSQPAQAIADYREAARRDGWYARNARLYARIGAIEGAAGFGDTPERRIYLAERMVDAAKSPNTIGRLPEAITIYDQLAAQGGEFAPLARRRAASIQTLYGRHLFADGALGESVRVWEGALKRNPAQWLASFYLTRGYYAVNRYDDAVRVARRLTETVADPSTLGDLYTNLGDALSGLNQLDAAHRAYFASYQLDYVSNRRGLDSLVGP